MESSLDVGMDIGGVLLNSWAPTPPIMRKEIKFFHYGHFWRPLGVTQSDNGASKKSIGNEPKIQLCGVIPNKLKHGGFGHRPSPLESLFSFLCFWFLLFGHSGIALEFDWILISECPHPVAAL